MRADTPTISRRSFFTGSTGQGVALAAVAEDVCLAWRGTVCQTCRDVCPEGAVRFRPTLGGPATPTIRPDVCTGCGECAEPCPVAAIRVVGGRHGG